MGVNKGCLAHLMDQNHPYKNAYRESFRSNYKVLRHQPSPFLEHVRALVEA